MLSHDLENDPDVLAMVAVSAALTISGIPFMGPVGAARVGMINNQLKLNPTVDEMKTSTLDLVVAGTHDAVLMVESEAREFSEETMLKAVMTGHAGFQPVIEAIIRLAEKAAKDPRDFAAPDKSAAEKTVQGVIEEDLRKAYSITPRPSATRLSTPPVQKPSRISAPSRATTLSRRRPCSKLSTTCSQGGPLEHPRQRLAHRRP